MDKNGLFALGPLALVFVAAVISDFSGRIER